MKKIYLSLFTLISAVGLSQIPNADFENWNITPSVTPANWNFFGQITQVPGANGNFAVRMERAGDAPGAIVHGNPDGNNFWGGLPTTDRPDSIVGNFNYSIAANDTAWVLVTFKKNGLAISFDIHKIYGNSGGNFLHLGFKNNYYDATIPDSVVVGVTSTNPDDTLQQPMGGFMIVDDLEFKDASGTTYPILNGDFEIWNTFNDEEPMSWFTSNVSYLPFGIAPVTKTTDAQNGLYALRAENLSGSFGLAAAYAIAGPQGQMGPMPGFPVTQRDSSFNGYYKFFPDNGDTASIGIMMFYQGNQVGWGFHEEFDTVNTYTYFSAPINYSMSFLGVPDSATVFVLPFRGGSNPYGNSVLYADNLSLNDQSVSIKSNKISPFRMLLYPNAANEFTNINYYLDQSSELSITIYDVRGKLIETISSNKQNAGAYILKYNTNDLANGLYSVEIKSRKSVQTQKLIVQH
ncbi:MAG: T9SS type A sorting domain-containing protein [Bacteroidota bacterium]|nr:T9SS type A sorting domain-containing protein [Bacteroidota bacterium]